MPSPLLRLSQIDKSFEGVRALHHVSFELRPGEVHALVGENGAGKSTLVKVMTGAVSPDAGRIEIGGQVLTQLAPAQAQQLGVACIYQHPALFPDLTVAENIGIRLERASVCQRIDWRRRRVVARDLLSRIGAAISVDATVSSLSMPNQQLVEIACAVGANARIVIMDEPTASLTQHEQHLLFGVVRELRRVGAGIIYVSHRLDEIFALADRVTVLRDGQNLSPGRIGDLTEPALIRLMVGRELALEEQTAGNDLRRANPPHGAESVLTLRDVGCSASGVKNISLELHEGEILGLAGLVGAGRTELARILFGLTPADSGEIHVRNCPVIIDSPQIAIAHGIAYLPEDRARHGIIAQLSVEQNLTMAIHRRIFPGGWIPPGVERRVASEYISALDVRPAAPAIRVASLSGGNQQKVALGRWLATQPTILILDEPTQGVDVGAKNEIHHLIRNLAKKGLAVLLISSDLPELLALSHRIGVMRAGRIASMLLGGSDPHQVMSAAFGQELPQ